MYSSLIRILLALIGLSPILLSLYIVKIIRDYKKLSLDFHIVSVNDFFLGLSNLIYTNYLLLLFAIAIILAHVIVKKARTILSIGRIEVKSIKPGDINFFPLLFSVILPFYKFYNPTFGDKVYLLCFVVIAVIYGLTMKGSYHFNIVLKLFLGYRHYEIATTGEITYLLLSKNKLVNKKQVSEYVYLTDYMLINVSDKPKDYAYAG